MARKSKRVAKNVVGASKAVRYIAVPTASLKKHAKYVASLDRFYDPAHNPTSPPRVRNSYKWVEDKDNTVQSFIETEKLRNPGDFSDRDYKKPVSRKVLQAQDRLKFRAAVRADLDKIKSGDLYVQQGSEPIQSPSVFRIVYFPDDFSPIG